ncbi:MAG: IMP dehydrogenase, partial [Limosilactobacillus fermentum]|nr:GMP reductase [Limosilactobacillus fermentum]
METFDYDDIQLIPNKCVIKSRKEADPQVKFGPKTFKIPVVPANMASVINEELAVWLAQNDYYYVMHRFNPADRAGFVKRMHDRGLFASISVGIKDSEYDFINQLKDEQLVPEYITIDVAHGHSDFVIAMIKHIKQQLPTTFLTAGNVATPEAVRDLENAGADATKVG